MYGFVLGEVAITSAKVVLDFVRKISHTLFASCIWNR